MMRQKSQIRSRIPLPASNRNGRRHTIANPESREKWDKIKGSQIPRLVIPSNRQQQPLSTPTLTPEPQPQPHPQLLATGSHSLPMTNSKRTKWDSLIHPFRRTVSHIPTSQTIQMQCNQIIHQRLQQRQKDLQRKHQQLIEEKDVSCAANGMPPAMALRLCSFLPFSCLNNDRILTSLAESKNRKAKPATKPGPHPYQIRKPLQFHRFFCSDNRQVNIPCQLMNRYSLFMRQHHKPMQLVAIRSTTLLRLLQWMQRHRHDDIQQLANTLPNPSSCGQENGSTVTPSWDEVFLGNGELSQLVELILACNYLGVDPLLMHATHYFGQLMALRSQAEQSLLLGISELLTDVQDSKIIHQPPRPMEQIQVNKQTSFRHHQCYHARV